MSNAIYAEARVLKNLEFVIWEKDASIVQYFALLNTYGLHV